MKYFTLAVLASLVLNACNNNSKTGTTNTTATASAGTSATPQTAADTKPATKAVGKHGGYLKFKPMAVNDPTSTGEALTFLVPEGWTMQGKIIWTTDNAYYPATAHVEALDPSGQLKFEYFPGEFYYATRNQMSLRAFPYGSRYMGATVVSEVPTSADAFKNYLIPRNRANAQNLKVVEVKTLVPAKKQADGNINSGSETLVMRIEYIENGKPYEENIYGIRSVTASPSYGFADWSLTNCYGFRAPKGKLNENMKLFQTMLNSIQLNKKWYANYLQMSQILAKKGYASIKAAGDRAKIQAQTADQIRQIQSDSYWKTQKANDEVFDRYSDYQRDVQTYVDPGSNESYKLPTGYNNAWKNANGEYIVSDEPGYNPNEHSTQSWTELQPKH